jgi:hypothetical protein
VTLLGGYPLVTFFERACGLSWIQESPQTLEISPKSLV